MQDTPSVPPDDQESSSPSTPSQSISPNRTIMLVLAYLGILALIPLLVETDDSEIQWHAKHGIVLMATWIVLSIALAIVSSIPVIGWVLGCGVGPFLLLFFTVFHIVAIVKAINGQRLKIPSVSDLVDKWQ